VLTHLLRLAGAPTPVSRRIFVFQADYSNLFQTMQAVWGKMSKIRGDRPVTQEGIAMRKILVVIDMQNDFIDGSLGTKEAQQIVPRVVEKMKEYDPWNLYLTRDTHYENYLDTQEGRNLPVEHCIEGTHGWQLNDAVAKAAEKATVIDKPTFGSNRLAGILMTERAQEALEIELVGLCTDICVVSNALLFKAAMPEAPITVDASCCAGVTPESHRHALETMKMCQIKVVND